MGIVSLINHIETTESELLKSKTIHSLYPNDKIGKWMQEMQLKQENTNAWVIYLDELGSKLRIERGLHPVRYKVIYKTNEGKIHAIITNSKFRQVLTIIKNDLKKLRYETNQQTI